MQRRGAVHWAPRRSHRAGCVALAAPVAMACEDFPCCGHEAGDCEGLLYGTDESIKQAVYDRMDDDPDAVDGDSF